MKNTVVTYTNLKPEVKKAFRTWVEDEYPETISFPYKGESVQGYVFIHDDTKYLVVTYKNIAANISDDDDDDNDGDMDNDFDVEFDESESSEEEDAA